MLQLKLFIKTTNRFVIDQYFCSTLLKVFKWFKVIFNILSRVERFI